MFVGLLALIAAAVFTGAFIARVGASTGPIPLKCDRACLEGVMNQYLAAVVAHYNGGFVSRASLSTHINRNLRLSAKERSDLIAFLRALSSEEKSVR